MTLIFAQHSSPRSKKSWFAKISDIHCKSEEGWLDHLVPSNPSHFVHCTILSAILLVENISQNYCISWSYLISHPNTNHNMNLMTPWLASWYKRLLKMYKVFSIHVLQEIHFYISKYLPRNETNCITNAASRVLIPRPQSRPRPVFVSQISAVLRIILLTCNKLPKLHVRRLQ